MNIDICIIGAGIIGTTIAHELSKTHSVCVLEERSEEGLEQTLINSGVVHSGIFYKENQNILNFCLDGKNYLNEFCKKNNLSIVNTGKKINYNKDYNLLETLINRCKTYNIKYSYDDNYIFLPEVNLVNYRQIASHHVKNKNSNTHYIFNAKILFIMPDYILLENTQIISYKILINATGLLANELYQKITKDNSYTCCEIIGNYHIFDQHLETMLYDAPNSSLPFVGPHYTPTLNNQVKLGPDAFPIIISKKLDNNIKDILIKSKFFCKNFEYFRKNLKNYKAKNMIEYSKKLNYEIDLNSYLKTISGTRSVLLNNSASIEKNFIFKKYKNQIHFLNSHSPAATCAFSIAKYIASIV